jgi:hypothetical protein
MPQLTAARRTGLVILPPPGPVPRILDQLRAGMSPLPFYWAPQIPLAPVLMAQAPYREICRAATGLLSLLRRAVWSLGASAAERGERLRMAAEFAALFTAEQDEWDFACWQARPDVILTGSGPKFIEFNVSAATGGIPHTEFMQRTWARLYDGVLPACTSPFGARAGALERLCAARGLDRSVVIISEPREPPAEVAVYDTQTAYLRRRGFRADHMLVEDLAAHGAQPGRRYAVALRQIVPQDRLDDGSGLEAVVSALRATEFSLAPHSSYQVANKQTLALLSEGRPWMNARDRRLIDRFVPWSRLVRERTVEYRGARRDLVALLLAEQPAMVLKQGTGNSGQRVVIGRAAGPAEWAAAVGSALTDGDWIAQEFAEPILMDMRLWDVASESVVTRALPGVLSPYFIEGRNAGCMVRYDLSESEPVVSIARPAVRFNTVLPAR